MPDGQDNWPEWWQWELELSGHLLRRMADRQFSEADLRAMLTDAQGYKPDVEPARWAIATRWQANPWEIVVEPDPGVRRLVVVTAYMIE